MEEQESEDPSWGAYDVVGLPYRREDESAVAYKN